MNEMLFLTESLGHALLEALGVGDVASEGAKDVAQIKRINVVAFVVLVEDDERIFRLCSQIESKLVYSLFRVSSLIWKLLFDIWANSYLPASRYYRRCSSREGLDSQILAGQN